MQLTITLTPEQESALAEKVAAILAERHTPSPAPRAYNVEEAANALGVAKATIRRRVAAGILPTVPLCGRVIRIPASALFPGNAR